MENLKNKAPRLSRLLERFFKLDVDYLAQSSLWTTLSFIVGFLSSIITMVAFGNLLPRETFGIYNYLLSLGASLSFLTLTGAGTGVLRAVARGYENVVRLALRLQLKYNSLAIITVLVAAIYYGVRGNMLFAGSLLMLAVAYPVAEAFHIYVQVLTGRKRFDLMAKITSAITLTGALATVVALLITDNILILVAVYASTSLFPKIIAYKVATKNIDKSAPNPEQVAEMRRTSFHMTGAGIIGVIASYIDKIILFQVAGPATLAVYSFAIAGPERLKSLIKNWMSIALPRLAQSSLLQIRQVLYQRIGFSLFIGLVLALLYFFLAPLLFKLFLPRYLDAIIYSQVQALSLIIAPAAIYIGSVFSTQNMLKANYALSIGNHIARIILFVTFGWLWQIWGLVAASIASHIINAVIGLIIWEIEFRRLTKTS
ncbi:MAG: oligosaccharide flippase family protein [Candidatus Zambryskibacteria bacterium]|nr:oligosaccharide flippase family protein [Candidatus Zambryskibacteria bacterium]